MSVSVAPRELPDQRGGPRDFGSRLAILWALRILLITVLLAIWELLPRLGVVDTFWISQPSRVLSRLLVDAATPNYWLNISVTVQEIVQGLALGGVAGVAIGIALGFVPYLYRVAEPVMLALYTLPRIALAPLFIIWFGIGVNSKIALVISLVFFIMLLNAYVGVRNVERDLIDSVRTMGASRLFLARRVILPSSLPWLFTGLRLSFVYGISGAVVGEMLIARNGLGTLLTASANNFDTTGVFEVLFVTAILGFLSNEMIGFVEGRFLRWRR